MAQEEKKIVNRIKEEYELDGEDLKIADSLRKESLSVIDKMISDLNKDDEYFIRFYPNEYSLWGNDIFRDILGLMKEKESEYPFGYPFSSDLEKYDDYLLEIEKNSTYHCLEKLTKSESVYTIRKTIQKILEIGRNLVEGCEYLLPYELEQFKRKKEAIMEDNRRKERISLRRKYCGHDFGPKVWTWECGGYRECRICGEREEFYERD